MLYLLLSVGTKTGWFILGVIITYSWRRVLSVWAFFYEFSSRYDVLSGRRLICILTLFLRTTLFFVCGVRIGMSFGIFLALGGQTNKELKLGEGHYFSPKGIIFVWEVCIEWAFDFDVPKPYLFSIFMDVNDINSQKNKTSLSKELNPSTFYKELHQLLLSKIPISLAEESA